MNKQFTFLLLFGIIQVLCISHFIHAQQTMDLSLSFDAQDAAGTLVTTGSKYDPLPGTASISSIEYDLHYTSSAVATCTLSVAGETKTDFSLPSSEGSLTVFSDSFTGVEFLNYPSAAELEASMICDTSVVLEDIVLSFTYSVSCHADQGLIVDGFCVCYSTFDGDDCSAVRSGTCNITEPEELKTTNPPSLDPSGSFSNRNLHLIAESGFVSDRYTESVTIGTSTSRYCSFPGPFWEGFASSEEICEDRLVSNIPWTIATQECDLTRSETETKIVFDGNLNIVQVDKTGESRGSVLTRSTKSVLQFQVNFPKTIQVDIGDSIDYFAPVDVQANLQEQSFDIDTAKGSVILLSSVQWPFILTTPSIAIIENEELQAVIQLHSNDECTSTVDSVCIQQWAIEITAEGDLCKLDGTYNSTFALECRGDGNCPLNPEDAASIVFTLTSSDFCATIGENLDVTGSLEPVEKLAYFSGETITLHAHVSSVQAKITSVVPIHVKTTLEGTETVIHDTQGELDPANVDFTIVSTEEMDADFSFTLDDTVFPIAADQNAPFDVEAILAITYEGNTKKRFLETRNFRAVMAQQLDTSVGTKFVYGLREADDGDSSESRSNAASLMEAAAAPAALISVLCVLLVLFF